MGKFLGNSSWHEVGGVAAGIVVGGLVIGLLEAFVIMPLMFKHQPHNPHKFVMRRAGFALY